jgi:CCR4-NOT transcriptional complex subunit CAF120
MSAIGGSPAVKQQAITPEQFVHQRAAAATPLYVHQRQSSGNVLRSGTPTPPLVRKRSSEFLAQQTHSRNNSAEMLQRPSSRGPSVALGPSGSGEYASHLSAREQEHLAKVTGQPLINMTSNNNRQAALGGGLVGAIEVREKERQQMKQGLSSQAVQHAIAQRQQQTQSQGYQQYPEQSSGDYRAPQTQYGSMGQYPQFPVQSQRQQSWVSPTANVYAQGGGWSAPAPPSAPAPRFPTPPEQQQPPQQQYFAPPQQQQGQGRGYQGYHGHGF